MLIGLIFARMTPAVTSLSEEIDNIEENVLDGRASVFRKQIVSIRKKTIIVKRYMAPKCDLVTDLLKTKIDWFADHNHHHMVEERTPNRSGNMLCKKKAIIFKNGDIA